MNMLIKAMVAFTFFLYHNQAASPLSNTKWIGIVNVPSPEQCTLEFKSDTMFLYINNDIIETTSYREKGDTLIFKKISGKSPCGDEAGEYTYHIKENVLTISLLNDMCSARLNAFTPEGYKKQ